MIYFHKIRSTTRIFIKHSYYYLTVYYKVVMKAIILLLIIPFSVFSQAKDRTTTVNLGVIKKENKVLYYVVREFKEVKTALGYHGHARLYFYNSKKQSPVVYEFAAPESLPVKLKGNVLYFPKNVTYTVPDKLPAMMCLSSSTCYERIEL
jgi:hypothetical protein